MLAEDRKNPHPRKRARRSTAVEEAQPPISLDADDSLSASPEPATRLSVATGRRPVVTARPVSHRDRRVVTTAELMTTLAPGLDEAGAALTATRRPEPPALVDVPSPAPLIIVSGDSTSKMAVMRVGPPKRKKRHWASGAVILALTIAISLTAIATVTPLASGHAEGLAVNAAGPLGLPVALDATNKAPSGQWVTMIGLQPNQDVGGGAGPGVKAPGSAGLPVASVHTVVNTGAPSAQAAGAVSPPPLSPWPPSNAFSAVPGYSAFGMSDVGGYYNWAFGQCTWWAQYERKDENLMHMGNAQYWASGAASRGYRVGGQPKVGATVVFQPGVQGAGGAGHVAHVVKVYPDNWFLVSEMNFYWNGGGWGRVDYRFAHAGSGVQFIY
jgi:surface antigen